MALSRVLVALALLVLTPSVLAQDAASPILLDRADDGDLRADAGRPAEAVFTLLNPTAESVFVVVEPDELRHWTATASDTRFTLGPRNETEVRVTFAPDDTPRGPARFEVVFLFTRDGGDIVRVTEAVEVGSLAPPRVIGIFRNPLPAPLDNAYGTFVLDLAFWIALGLVSVLAGDWLVRLLTMRASSLTTRAIILRLRRPVFLLVLFLGLSRSFAILPRNVVTDFIARFLAGVAVTVFGLYVVYALLDAFLYYYQKEISKRTQTDVDDILIPVIRKVGLVIIYVVGIVVTLRRLGWDPTIAFAGAGIAGLVIAFAAQDTFSNLFSGVFLMLDRPFVEGDDITLESGDTARVMSIGLRTTRLHNYQTYEDIVVPNNQLATRRIINHTRPDPRTRVSITVGVGYGSDPEKVRAILLDVARADPRVAKEEPFHPVVRFHDFGDSALLFTLRVVLPHFQDRNNLASELRFAIKKRFDAEGIEIPYPQRTIHIKQG